MKRAMRLWRGAPLAVVLLTAIGASGTAEPSIAAETAETWLFNGSTQGWTASSGTSISSTSWSLHVVFANGGGIYSSTFNYIPGADTYHRDYVRFGYVLAPGSQVTQFKFNFATSTRANFNSPDTYLTGLRNDGQVHYLTFRVDNIGDWKTASRITQLRFVSTVAGGGGATGTIDLDFMALREDDKLPESYPGWDDACPHGPAVSVSPSGWTRGPITVTIAGSDPPPYLFAPCATTPPDRYGSGVASYHYSLNGAAPVTVAYDDQDAQWPSGVSTSVITFGQGSLPTRASSFSVQAFDRVGFGTTTSTPATLYYDGTPPGTPAITQLTPSSWTYDNRFSVAWTNPGDVGSGVSYFDVAVDGGVIGSTGGTAATIGAPANGRHSVQVRAVDAVGNLGAWSSPSYMYLDDADPTPPGVPVATPAGNSVQDNFSFSWTPGSDGVSGVQGYLYSIDGAEPTLTSATSVSGALASGHVGPHAFYVATEDLAGNVSSWQSVPFYYYPQWIGPVTGLTPTATQAALPSTFSWNATGASHSYYLQVSADSTFAGSPLTLSTDVPWLMIPAVAAPSMGQPYYWRVATTTSVPLNWSNPARFSPYVPPPPPVSQVIGQDFPSGELGDGVNTSLGAVTRAFTILTLRGPGGEVPLTAWYSSIAQRNSLLGSRWNWTLGQLLTPAAGGATVTLEDNQDIGFTQAGSAFAPALGIYDSLAQVGAGYLLTRPSRMQLAFDSLGTLQKVTDRNSNAITLQTTGGVLDAFTDQAGRTYTVTLSSSRITQIQDIAGHMWKFEYDGAGYMSAFTDAKGARTQFEYDAQGRLTRVIDPLGHDAIRYSYDGSGRVQTQTDVLSHQTTFAYDDVNRRTTVTDPLGKTKTHVYDVNYRLVSDIDELGNTTTYEYDANHNLIATTDPLGRKTVYGYDPRGNRYLEVNALGDSTQTVFDYSNSPVLRHQSLGKITRWTNDDRGNPLSVAEPLGKTTILTYNSAGQVQTALDANSHQTSYGYDAQGNRTTATDGEGDVTHFGYDSIGRRTSVTDAVGHATSFTFDNDDSLLSRTDGEGDVTQYEYDANGNRTAVEDPRLGRTEYTYDARDRLIQEKDALGDLMAHEYDALDRRRKTTDPRGGPTLFSYDDIGNLLNQQDAAGGLTSYTYDPCRNKLTETDPRGKITHFAYDALNRLLTTTDPLGHSTTNTYDALGRLVSVSNPRHFATTYQYDLLDRLTDVIAPTGGDLHYDYDLVGNRTATTNANGHTSRMTYDRADRLLTEADPLGNTQHYFYDAAGHRIQRTDARGRITFYTYDRADRLVRTTYDDSTRVERTYDTNGNLTGLRDQWGSDSYTYDPLNRIMASTDHYGNALAFAYDSTGNQTAITYPGGEVCRYTFDPLNRMTTVTDWKARKISYAYDPAGNNTGITYPNGVVTGQTFDDADHVTSILTLNPAADTVVAFSYTLDENGNRTRIIRVDKREDPRRISTGDVYATSAALSSAAFPTGADSVVLAAGEDWSEAIGAPTVAHRMGGPTLVVPGDNLWASATTQAELTRLKGTRASVNAAVMGDIVGISPVVEAQLGQEGYAVHRIRGADRFGTAGATVEPADVAVILGATDAVRAGGAALIAARFHAPVILTERDSLPPASIAALASSGATRTILVGDDSTIGSPVEMWLNGNGYPVWWRHGSLDPSALSVAALEDTIAGSDRYDDVHLADRAVYQDALSAAGSSDPWTIPTLLAGPDSVRNSPDLVRWIGRHKGWLKHATLLGSEAALSANAAAELRNLLRTTVTEYSYSKLDELTSEIIPGVDTTTYDYDAIGNRASLTHNRSTTTYSYDNAERLGSAGSVIYSYDGNGNRLSRLDGATAMTYAFDYENRLTRINAPSGPSNYCYDGTGRRIRSAEPNSVVRYALDPTAKPYRTLHETDDAGHALASYVYGDGLAADVSAVDSVRYYHFDGLGSTAAVTDGAAEDANHLAYTAFGDTAELLGSSPTRLGYVGQYGVEIAASGLTFMRNRFYDPAVGAFVSQDPQDNDARDFCGNASYLYAGGDPVLNIDPAGTSFLDWVHRAASTANTWTGAASGGVLDFIAKSGTSAVSRSADVAGGPVSFLSGAAGQLYSDARAGTPGYKVPARAVVAGVKGAAYGLVGGVLIAGALLTAPVSLPLLAVAGIAAAGVATTWAVGTVADKYVSAPLQRATDAWSESARRLPQDVRTLQKSIKSKPKRR